MRFLRKRYTIPGVLLLVVGLAFVWFLIFNPWRHQHCIVGALFALEFYAQANGGQYPTSENGWADALLKLDEIEGAEDWIRTFTGVDDDGSVFREALKRGGDIDERKCTRIYVQGLSTDSTPGIAILFDRRSVRGGDHFRSPFMPRMREVILTPLVHEIIEDADWPDFVSRQKQLLQQEGFSDEVITSLYGETQ